MTCEDEMDHALLPRKLRDEIAERIAEAIIAGRHRTGDYLPNEQEMAQQFGVSRTVIREAMRTLSARGLVDVQQGRGALVIRGPTQAMGVMLNTELRRKQGTPAHLLEARRMLETAVVALAAERATDEDLAQMTTALEGMRASVDAEGYIGADLAFHGALVQASHNPIMVLLNDAIAGLLRASRKQTYDIPGAVEHSLVDHAQLYEAIRQRDRHGALRAIQEVMDRIEADFALLEGTGGSGSFVDTR